jgi:hypothetical protein
MSKQHVCNTLTEINSQSSFNIQVIQKNNRLYLYYRALASKLDVHSGEADYEGEELTNISILIQYCPFCGKSVKSMS